MLKINQSVLDMKYARSNRLQSISSFRIFYDESSKFVLRNFTSIQKNLRSVHHILCSRFMDRRLPSNSKFVFKIHRSALSFNSDFVFRIHQSVLSFKCLNYFILISIHSFVLVYDDSSILKQCTLSLWSLKCKLIYSFWEI